MRVTSPKFPGFTGMTEDISVTGLKVVTRELLKTGETIPVNLELDDSQMPTISLHAEVAWSAVKGDHSYHSGLRITDIHPDSEQMIRRYIKTRLAIEKRFHTTEEIDPADIM